jgi:hypothetical protein
MIRGIESDKWFIVDFEDTIAHQIFPHYLSGLSHALGAFMGLKFISGALNHNSRSNEFSYSLL